MKIDRWGREVGEIHVPATYQTDDAPAADLRKVDVNISERGHRDGKPAENARGERTPFHVTIALDCNLAFAQQLVAFFRERGHGAKWEGKLPELPPTMSLAGLPQVSEQVARNALPLREDPMDAHCRGCGHRHHEHDDSGCHAIDYSTDGFKYACGCLGFDFA